MVLSLRETPSAMVDDLDDAKLDEIEVGIKQFAATMEHGASKMITSMDSIISKLESLVWKMELVNSKINAITESDEDHSSQLVSNEAVVVAIQDFSCSDQIEAQFAMSVKRWGLEEDSLSSPTITTRSLDSTIILPSQSEISPTTIKMVGIDDCKGTVTLNTEHSDVDMACTTVTPASPVTSIMDLSFPMLQDFLLDELQNFIGVHKNGPLMNGIYFFQIEDQLLDLAKILGANFKLLQSTFNCPDRPISISNEWPKRASKHDGVLLLHACSVPLTTTARFNDFLLCLSPTAKRAIGAIHGSMVQWVFDPGSAIESQNDLQKLATKEQLDGYGFAHFENAQSKSTQQIYVACIVYLLHAVAMKTIENYFKEGVEPINWVVENEFHGEILGGTRGVETIGNFVAVLKNDQASVGGILFFEDFHMLNPSDCHM